MDLGPQFRAKLAHLSAKFAIKAPFEAPLGALEAPLGALGRHLGSKMLPRRLPEATRPPQTSILINFQIIIGRDFVCFEVFLTKCASQKSYESTSYQESLAIFAHTKFRILNLEKGLSHFVGSIPTTNSVR